MITPRHFKPISSATTIIDALNQIGANFTVTKVPLFYRLPVGPGNLYVNVEREAPFHNGIMRMGTGDLLGVTSKNYGTIQYRDSLAITEKLVSSGEAKYIAGFCFGRGEKIYIVMTDGQEYEIDPNLKILNYFTLSTGHDGVTMFEINPTPIRVDNFNIFTFTNQSKIWTRHSKHVSGRLEELKNRVGKIKNFWTEFVETTQKLSKIKVNDEVAKKFFRVLVPGDSVRSENIREVATILYKTGPQNVFPSCNGTLLGCLMAFIDYCDRHKTVRESKKIDKASCDVRAYLDGEAARQKAEAYSCVLEFAKIVGSELLP